MNWKKLNKRVKKIILLKTINMVMQVNNLLINSSSGHK